MSKTFKPGSSEDTIAELVAVMLHRRMTMRQDTSFSQVYAIEFLEGASPLLFMEARELAADFAKAYCERLELPEGSVSPIRDFKQSALVSSMYYFAAGDARAGHVKSLLPIRIFVRGGRPVVVVEIGLEPVIVA